MIDHETQMMASILLSASLVLWLVVSFIVPMMSRGREAAEQDALDRADDEMDFRMDVKMEINQMIQELEEEA